MTSNKLPVRVDVQEYQYHRPATKSEIKFGYGCTHYRHLPVEVCCHAGTGIKKRWFIADDGLRYYA